MRHAPFQLRSALATWIVVLGGAFGASAAEKQDLPTSIIEKNEKARERIRSYEYTAEVELRRDDAPPRKGTASLKVSGSSVWCIYKRPGLNRNIGQLQDVEARTVINDKYAASWPMAGNPIAYIDEHESSEKMDRRVATRTHIHLPPDPLPHCFGHPGLPFRKEREQHTETRWDAVEAKDDAGRPVYHVRRFMPRMDDPAKPDMIWVIDPAKGFLATASIAYKKDGQVWNERKIQFKEFDGGIWFPVGYEEQRFGGPADVVVTLVTDSEKVTLNDVKVNCEFPAGQFEIKALDIHKDMPGARVLRTNLDGSKVPHVFTAEGELVPERRPRAGATRPATRPR